MNADSFSVNCLNSRRPLKFTQRRSAPICACAARTLGVTAISKNPYDMTALRGEAEACRKPRPPGGSCGLGSVDDGEVDLGLGDLIEIVGEAVLGDERDDLDDLGIAEAGGSDRSDVLIANVASLFRHLRCKTDGSVCFGITRGTLAIESDFLRADLREIQPQIGVRREAIVAAVHLGDRQCNALAGLHIESLAQRSLEAREASERGGAI